MLLFLQTSMPCLNVLSPTVSLDKTCYDSGDHGMTEDGNHGGGTEDEINAALFAHFSSACGNSPLDIAPQIGTEYIQHQFQSIHQIDLGMSHSVAQVFLFVLSMLPVLIS